MLAVAVMLMTACTGGVVYDRYLPAGSDGWQRRDTLVFGISPTDGNVTSHTMHTTLGLRITDDYPFSSVTLIVDERVTDRSSRTTHTSRRDTIVCSLTDARGRRSTTGVSCHHYSFALEPVSMTPTDSLTIAVSHHMRRERLPGIIDVGIKIK